MKKIINSAALVVLYPLKFFRKIKLNTFLGGLLIGAMFSLIVNLITAQVQEIVTKQHILEAVENEILSNTLMANNIVDSNKADLDSGKKYNPFRFIRKYSRDLWEQSSEPLQYISQLDQERQIAVIGYYTITIPLYNGALDNLEKFTYSQLANCMPLEGNLKADESEHCKLWNQVLLESEKSTALSVAGDGFKVLKVFHPTKDRLNNWFLKLIMGNKSTRVLSGE